MTSSSGSSSGSSHSAGSGGKKSLAVLSERLAKQQVKQLPATTSNAKESDTAFYFRQFVPQASAALRDKLDAQEACEAEVEEVMSAAFLKTQAKLTEKKSPLGKQAELVLSQLGRDEHSAWTKSLAKGKKLVEVMEVDDHAAGQLFTPRRSSASSPFSYLDVAKWGYGKFTPAKKFSPTVETLLANLGADIKGFTTLSWEMCPEGHFEKTMNAAAGIMIAADNLVPRFCSHEIRDLNQGPPLKHWSDVAFLQWQSVTSDPSNLRLVYQQTIINATTNQVVKEVMGIPPSTEDLRLVMEKWPGRTFGMDEPAGQALLGTPNRYGVAFMLVQRKKELGHKVVDRVTVFQMFGCTHLLFYLKDVEG